PLRVQYLSRLHDVKHLRLYSESYYFFVDVSIATPDPSKPLEGNTVGAAAAGNISAQGDMAGTLLLIKSTSETYVIYVSMSTFGCHEQITEAEPSVNYV
ncbi:MAG: hypothetical protein SNF93_06970, partial [Rikenellaceae bacterium]